MQEVEGVNHTKAKIKALEPKKFDEVRSATELKNFIWDIEQYFKAAKIPEAERVSMTTMFRQGMLMKEQREIFSTQHCVDG